MTVRAWETMNVRDVQKLQLPTKTSPKFTKSVLDDRRIKVREIAEVMNKSKDVLSHIKSTFRHEKAVRALIAAYVHGRPKTCSNEHFQCSVGAV